MKHVLAVFIDYVCFQCNFLSYSCANILLYTLHPITQSLPQFLFLPPSKILYLTSSET